MFDFSVWPPFYCPKRDSCWPKARSVWAHTIWSLEKRLEMCTPWQRLWVLALAESRKLKTENWMNRLNFLFMQDRARSVILSGDLTPNGVWGLRTIAPQCFLHHKHFSSKYKTCLTFHNLSTHNNPDLSSKHLAVNSQVKRQNCQSTCPSNLKRTLLEKA